MYHLLSFHVVAWCLCEMLRIWSLCMLSSSYSLWFVKYISLHHSRPLLLSLKRLCICTFCHTTPKTSDYTRICRWLLCPCLRLVISWALIFVSQKCILKVLYYCLSGFKEDYNILRFWFMQYSMNYKYVLFQDSKKKSFQYIVSFAPVLYVIYVLGLPIFSITGNYFQQWCGILQSHISYLVQYGVFIFYMAFNLHHSYASL